MAGLALGMGLGLTRRPRLWTPPVYDTDAVTLFEAMTVQPGTARKRLISDTIIHLKDIGAWPRIDILYATAAHHAQASRINWKDRAQYMLTPQNAPTFVVDRGWQGDNATSYLGSGYLPATHGVNWTVNDASLWMWGTSDLSIANPDAGAGTGFVTALVASNAAGNLEGLCNRVGTTLSGSVSTAMGLSGIQRRGAEDAAAHWGASLSPAQIGQLHAALHTYLLATGALS